MGFPGVPWNEKQRASGNKRTRASLYNRVYWQVARLEQMRGDLGALAHDFDARLPGEDHDEVGAALHRASELLADAEGILEPHARRERAP